MKIKRFITAILLFTMLLTMLSACGGDSSETDVTTSGTTESVTEKQNQTETDSEEITVETETEEETIVITDVMVGETLEAEYAADFSVSKIFSDDMVVQRGEHIRVWGFANESENGKKVSGEFKGMFAEALIENGEWCLTFGARMEADTNGAEMKIYTDKKEVIFKDVLVGDVYLVMGQSNAAYTVSSHIQYADPATQGGGKDAIDPDSIIRLNFLNGSGGSYPEMGSDYIYPDLKNTKYWTRTTESNTLSFSAIGYYFARHMVEKAENKVPVGLIEVAKGGAPLVSFLPNDLADKFGADYYDSYVGVYYSNISKEHMGRYLYNCYLAPISKYAIAGVVWYQGESNNSQQNAMNYCEEFGAFIERLRSTHNLVKKNFPVFVAEFPSIYQKPASYSGSDTWHYMELGVIRSYMGLLPLTVKNCYVGASGDVWGDKSFPNNLHPNCKYEQAGRLADIAEVVILGNSTLDNATGPIFKSCTISEDKKTAVLTFTNVGDGLTTADGGTAVTGMVGFINKDFVYNTVSCISAEITGKDQVTITFDEEIKSVAYNYSSGDYFGETMNLCNSAGIPALAFIAPCEEKEVDNFSADSFLTDKHKSLGKKGKSIDTLTAGDNNFAVGGIESQLASVGNKVTVTDSTSSVSIYGWVGFKHEIMLFGYSIDDGNAVFNAYPSAAQQAVIDAGGKYAKRFTISADIRGLEKGTHKINFLALVNLDGGTAVKILSFTLIVTETPEVPKAPEGLTLPTIYDGGFVAASFDIISVDGTELYRNFDQKLIATGNKIQIKKGAKELKLQGWIGFADVIECFGYAIDGKNPVESTPISPEPAVINLAGANAKRYVVSVPVQGLEAGLHTVDLFVKTKSGNESVTMNMITVTLDITE